MKYILHDLQDSSSLDNLTQAGWTVISANKPAARCIGCFKCWLKKPGKCTFADHLMYTGRDFITSEEIVILCKGLYGGYSVSIKRVIDRVIPGVLPFFMVKEGKLHHSKRYQNETQMKVIIYNEEEISELEKTQLQNVVKGNAINFHARDHKVIFTPSIEQGVEEVLKCVH